MQLLPTPWHLGGDGVHYYWGKFVREKRPVFFGSKWKKWHSMWQTGETERLEKPFDLAISCGSSCHLIKRTRIGPMFFLLAKFPELVLFALFIQGDKSLILDPGNSRQNMTHGATLWNGIMKMGPQWQGHNNWIPRPFHRGPIVHEGLGDGLHQSHNWNPSFGRRGLERSDQSRPEGTGNASLVIRSVTSC